ncbi:heme NO-binding domain-containing protein [Antarctobacter heliothermus]|uniref:Haem-NO-binding n=1 Tax=Antarctobacter heliothermus TaxID=74033 RepID=A0A239LG47_9RHOB|nr:heme NO-binding domain-containing protein [Antarctobacter heliothermus]SNT28912.1 Haem-NO-binding [Antarctobacter heliothermus]
MHGLILRTFQVFIEDTYGPKTWGDIAVGADLDLPAFEPMLNYPPETYSALIGAAEQVLGKPAEAIWEDVGTYLVSHPNSEGLRRLLRFGGVDFIEFLHSLDDLPDRTRLAVADLVLPELELTDSGNLQFGLRVGDGLPGFGYVMIGVLRAMADDYGALALLDTEGGHRGEQILMITVIETAYAEGREFELAANTGGSEG